MIDKKPLASVVLFLCALLCGAFILYEWRKSPPPVHAAPHFDPLKHCSTEHGTLLGYAHSVPAFSNCHRRYGESDLLVLTRFGRPEFVLDYNDRAVGNFISGTPWTSTEYVSRFLFHHRGVTFASVPAPQDVWMADSFYNPLETKDGKNVRKYESVRFANYEEATTAKKRKRFAPKFADIIVWPAQEEKDLHEGHLAVVVRVEDDVKAAGGEEKLRELRRERLQPQLVYIAEQSFDNMPWEGRNYSRVLRFYWRKGKEAVLEDPTGVRVLGLVRKGKLAAQPQDDDLGDL